MSHTVAVGEFEGPLGVLLELIDRGKLPVSNVSVGRITSEYLAHVRELRNVSAEELSEFLQLGARLLYIKSLSLLPQESSEEQADELSQLSIELEEYRRFQAAAKLLAGRAGERTWQRPVVERLSADELPLPAVTLDQLAEAFTRALKFAPTAPATGVLKRHISLEAVTNRLRTELPDGFELHRVIERCRDRIEIIVTFLAVLELIRGGAAAVTQAGQFEPIRVEAARG